jgi:hypothetical protein
MLMKRSKSKFLYASKKLHTVPYLLILKIRSVTLFRDSTPTTAISTTSMFTEKLPVMLKIVPKAGHGTVPMYCTLEKICPSQREGKTEITEIEIVVRLSERKKSKISTGTVP